MYRKKESIKKHFKTCMTNFYQNIFLTKFSTIENSSKLILYKDLKRNLNMENYLLYENFEKRRLITKLRIMQWPQPSNLKIPREKRLCQVCNQIEDEHHFLFVCNKNLDLRNKYLPLIFQDRSNIEGEKIKYILCPSSPVQVGKIGS
jgi:hypothetical protein